MHGQSTPERMTCEDYRVPRVKLQIDSQGGSEPISHSFILAQEVISRQSFWNIMDVIDPGNCMRDFFNQLSDGLGPTEPNNDLLMSLIDQEPHIEGVRACDLKMVGWLDASLSETFRGRPAVVCVNVGAVDIGG